MGCFVYDLTPPELSSPDPPSNFESRCRILSGPVGLTRVSTAAATFTEIFIQVVLCQQIFLTGGAVKSVEERAKGVTKEWLTGSDRSSRGIDEKLDIAGGVARVE
jgi:hypothetical protein